MRSVAIVRGFGLNKYEMQSYEPLSKEFKITAISTYSHDFATDEINLPIKRLHCLEEIILLLPFYFKKYGYYFMQNLWGKSFYLYGLEKKIKSFDIIHAVETYQAYSYQAIQCKKKFGNKVVVTVWQNLPFIYEKHPIKRKIKREVRNNTDLFIAVTERAKETLILEGVSPNKIKVIFPGVDLKKFSHREKDSTLMKKIGLDKNDFVIVFVGRLSRSKGVYELLFAIQMILNDPDLIMCSIKVLIIGQGSEENKIRKFIKIFKLSNNFKLLGFTPYNEIKKLYNIADIFLLPSIITKLWQEQFGFALVEAMASGKAIVSTLSGSIPEVLGDAGILVEPNDYLSIYRGLKKFILNADLRSEIGQKARRRAETLFDAQETSAKIAQAYNSLF
jgi:glycosyltransferase involved in cell wall biosynthesis